jgi:ATP synthase protein I
MAVAREPENYFSYASRARRRTGEGNRSMPEVKKNSRQTRDVLWLSALGINLVGAGAAGLVMGYYLDKWLKIAPVMTILFFCIGTIAGFRQIYREVRRLEKSDDKKNELR